MFKNKYRIIRSLRWLTLNTGLVYKKIYIAETKKWWFPFIWVECEMSNCFYNIEDAEKYIIKHKEEIKIKNRIREIIPKYKKWKREREDKVIKYVT